MNHLMELFLFFFSQRFIMLIVLIPFAAVVILGSIGSAIRRL